MRRLNYVPAPQFFALNQACRLVNEALRDGECYHVGSSMRTREFRDVDVRFIMDDAAFDALFGGAGGWLDARWSLLCVTIADWLSRQTGLPIDFQIQRQTNANAEHPGEKRNALGIFLDYPGKRPSDLDLPGDP